MIPYNIYQLNELRRREMEREAEERRRWQHLTRRKANLPGTGWPRGVMANTGRMLVAVGVKLQAAAQKEAGQPVS